MIHHVVGRGLVRLDDNTAAHVGSNSSHVKPTWVEFPCMPTTPAASAGVVVRPRCLEIS